MVAWFSFGATVTGWDANVLIGLIIWLSITALLLKYLPRTKKIE